MTLGERQERFSLLVSEFIVALYGLGFAVRFGEVLRTEYQQAENIRTGASKTMHSTHLLKLAADLSLFRKGQYITGGSPGDNEALLLSGKLWEKMVSEAGLVPEWGGRFGIDPLSYETKIGWDANHYGIKDEDPTPGPA